MELEQLSKSVKEAREAKLRQMEQGSNEVPFTREGQESSGGSSKPNVSSLLNAIKSQTQGGTASKGSLEDILKAQSKPKDTTTQPRGLEEALASSNKSFPSLEGVEEEALKFESSGLPIRGVDTTQPKPVKKAVSIDDDDDDEGGSDVEWKSIQGVSEKIASEIDAKREEEDEDEGMDIEKLLSMAEDILEPVFEDIDPTRYELRKLTGDFRSMADEILAFKPQFRADTLKTPLEVSLHEFLSILPDKDFIREEFKYSLRDTIHIDTNDPFIKMILGIQNLKKNKLMIDQSVKDDLEYIETLIEEEVSLYRGKNEEILLQYEKAIHEKSTNSEKYANTVRDNLVSINNNLDSSVDEILSSVLRAKGSEFNKHLNDARDLKKKIDSKKKELQAIMYSMNKGADNSLDTELDVVDINSGSMEDISQLIKEVRNHLENLEFNDVPYFKKYISKFFDYFFLVTAKADGEVRSLIFLLNILGFVLFLKFLSPVFITFILATISMDAFQFFKLVDRNKSTAFLVQYSEGIESKIEEERNKALSEVREGFKEQIAILNEIVNDKSRAVKKFLDEINDFNLHLMNSFITYNEIKELTFTRFKKIERIINQIGENKINEVRRISNEVLSEIPEKIEHYVDELKKAPDEDIMEKNFKESFIWDCNYKVGRYGVTLDNLQVGVDANISLSEGSYIIYLNSEEEKRDALDQLFKLIVQQYNNIKPENFKVNYVDLTGLGADLIPMMSIKEEVSKTIIEDADYKTLLKEIRAEMGERFSKKIKGHGSCTEFNERYKDSPEVEKIPYVLNVLYGVNDKSLSESSLMSIAKNARVTGMPLVVFFNYEDAIKPDNKGERKPSNQMKEFMNSFDYSIEKSYGEWHLRNVKSHDNIEGEIFKTRSGMEKFPMKFGELDYMDKIKQVEGYIEDSKMTILYFKDLLKHYAPVLHQGDTIDGVEMCLGYKDGDFTKPYTVSLDNTTVHALMGGSTGSGKSNTINVILACMIAKYSSEWLELNMLDFKIVEFKFYTKVIRYGEFTKAISELPQASLIAGTKDPEYAVSIFKRLVNEMARRYKMMANGINHEGKTISFKQVSVWNKFVIENGLREKGIPVIPRIVNLIDEFQAMFKMEDEEKKAYIKLVISDLGKEARAAGIHMFFTSQSMDNTVPDDIKAQFLLRFCLAASPPTSNSVLGNKEASTLSGKGYIFMNKDSDRAVEKNVKIKVPFIPEDDLKQLMKDVQESHRNLRETLPYPIPYYEQEYYDEEKIHKSSELDVILSLPDVKNVRDVVVLGNKTEFSDKSSPANFILGSNDYENVMYTANSKLTIANMTNLLLGNLKSKNNGEDTIIYVNYDATLEGLIKEEEYLHPDDIQFVKETKHDFMNLLDVVIEDALGVTIEQYMDWDKVRPTVPIYTKDMNKIFLFVTGMNKAPGFNGDMHDPKHQDRLVWLLKNGPMFGVNLILSWKEPFRANKYLPYIGYRIAGRISPDFSNDLFRHRRAKDLNIGDKGYFGVFKSVIDDREFKFKVYEFEYPKELLGDSELKFDLDLGEGEEA